MNAFLGLVALAGLIAVVRIYFSLQNARNAHRKVDFDEHLIARLRADGLDPFSQHRVDFFLALPDETSANKLLTELRGRGFAADLRPSPEATDFPFSVHVSRDMHLTVGDIKQLATELGGIARANGGRYDGWTAGRNAGTADN
jgi:hypothetical protein